VEECLILRDVFDKLGPGMRKTMPNYEELYGIVDAGIAALLEWSRKWLDIMGKFSQPELILHIC
jgi:hypothetical protein